MFHLTFAVVLVVVPADVQFQLAADGCGQCLVMAIVFKISD